MILNSNKISFQSVNRTQQVALPDKDKKIIDDLSSQLKSGEQSALSYIKALNEFNESNNSAVVYNPRNGSYMLRNYYIVPGYMDKNSKFLDNLRFLNRAGFCKTSAPQLITCHQSYNDSFGVSIYKLNETEGGVPLPYLDMGSEVPIEKKERFFDEQVTLIKSTSLYNPVAFEDQKAWLVTPDTKNIYIDTWSRLEKCPSPGQKKALIQRLKSLLK